MYWEHFGFREPPFALTPNPAFLFLSSPHQEAFAHLLFAIEHRAGFIELSGEVGTGKTTLVRTLLNELDPETYRTALIFNPTVSPLGLMKEINCEFGIACDGSEIRDLHQALNAFLLEENRAGRTVVLVIDEAQNLSVEVLEQIRLISNLETESDKLIQIVLVGQPELKALLSRAELRQLDQRITVRYHLKPMCFADSCEYIRHRVRFAAGGREPLTFSPGALKRIFRHSGGLPRLINGVCDRALLLAYTRECKEVSASMAALSIADLRKESPRKLQGRVVKLIAACVGVAVIAAVALTLMPRQSTVEAKKPVVVPVAAISRDAAMKELASVGEQENLYTSVNAVLSAWQTQSVTPVPAVPASVKSLARQRGLTATRITGTLDTLTRLDTPALLHIGIPGGGSRMVALTAIDKESFSVVPAIAGRSRVTAAELRQLWSGDATILWKDFHGLSASVKRGDKAESVKLLQGLLKGVGCYGGDLNGKAGRKTQDAVAEFQRREQLKVDGQAAGVTLLLLYRRAGGFFPPGIGASHASATTNNT